MAYLICVSVRQIGPSPLAAIERIRRAMRDVLIREQVGVVKELVAECFAQQQEPSGKPWPERKDGSGRPLLLTIGEALVIKGVQDTVYVDCPSKPHADYQYWGTRTIPARPWVPKGDLSPNWRARIAAQLNEVIRKAMKGS